jgi:glyoxylase-like metal-dependent hydrolase (beta-lactamase superfamily II)
MQRDIHARISTLEIWWEAAQVPVGAYVIWGEANAIVDTGPPQGSADVISSVLGTIALTRADVDLILNTHGHIDHIGGDVFLKEAGRASLMIHEDDAVFLEDHERSFELFYTPRRECDIQQEKVAFLRGVGPEVVVDRRLGDNELIDLGDGAELKVVHLPGHTPGSVGFYWENEAILLCGDSVLGLGMPGGFLPLIYDLSSYEKSIKRLMEMPLRMMLFSHPQRGLRLHPSLVREDREVQEYLSDSLEMARRLREAFRRRAADEQPLTEVADSVVEEFPAKMGFKRMAELPFAQMSLDTVAWGIAQARNERGIAR